MLYSTKKEQEKQYTLAMIKPKTELYTGKTQDEIRIILEDLIEKKSCYIVDEYNKIFTSEEAELHYKHLSLLGFFPNLIEYITSGASKLLLIE